MISLVPLSHIDGVWPAIANGMKEACWRCGGDITPDWLFQICRKGEALLFVAHEGEEIKAGLVCRVENWSGAKVLRIQAACGMNMETWLQSVMDYREWLDNLAIEKVIFEGRKGWERMVPQARVLRQVYEVELR